MEFVDRLEFQVLIDKPGLKRFQGFFDAGRSS